MFLDFTQFNSFLIIFASRTEVSQFFLTVEYSFLIASFLYKMSVYYTT